MSIKYDGEYTLANMRRCLVMLLVHLSWLLQPADGSLSYRSPSALSHLHPLPSYRLVTTHTSITFLHGGLPVHGGVRIVGIFADPIKQPLHLVVEDQHRNHIVDVKVFDHLGDSIVIRGVDRLYNHNADDYGFVNQHNRNYNSNRHYAYNSNNYYNNDSSLLVADTSSNSTSTSSRSSGSTSSTSSSGSSSNGSTTSSGSTSSSSTSSGSTSSGGSEGTGVFIILLRRTTHGYAYQFNGEMLNSEWKGSSHEITQNDYRLAKTLTIYGTSSVEMSVSNALAADASNASKVADDGGHGADGNSAHGDGAEGDSADVADGDGIGGDGDSGDGTVGGGTPGEEWLVQQSHGLSTTTSTPSVSAPIYSASIESMDEGTVIPPENQTTLMAGGVVCGVILVGAAIAGWGYHYKASTEIPEPEEADFDQDVIIEWDEDPERYEEMNRTSDHDKDTKDDDNLSIWS
eukprot:GHVQ01003799.1.p1 GENE.GHVQ01003799.1~~GHVQ01003799.1.p1  ORF type:complete len:459 (-),score=105.80 GHVQ01003799.1:874-2250(-)